MLNITVIGRVAKELDIRKDANGTPYAIVEVTTHRTYKSAEGTHITDTVPVKLYDKQVELFQRFAFPGSRIAIIDNFELSPFENSGSEYWVYFSQLSLSASVPANPQTMPDS
ncbi:MAG: single-stranded DNA-binding protein [Oscillospiraceae bacterium]|nr:single-stranded DNA-binding protein [Oscillospiraceae bacterium]